MASGSDKQADPVAAAMAALKEAADSLAETAATLRAAADPPRDAAPAERQPPDSSPTPRYYQDLRERGELVDVDERTDLTQLPPHVTHVRLPDGRIRRIGYS